MCADYFQLTGHSYLTIVHRFSGWLCIYAFKVHKICHNTLQQVFCDLLIAYGVPDELSTDSGSQFMAKDFQDFLKLWGVTHRLWSARYPHSNGQAEVAVKAAKHIIHNNCLPDGGLNTAKAARAILQYCNTPLPNIALSPAQILLHRQLRDSTPAHLARYQLHKEWVLTAEEREKALSKRNHILMKNQNVKTRELQPLPLGTNVLVQGENKKWECTERVVEVLLYRQHRVKMFHSGQVTHRNRRFLRGYMTIVPEAIRPLPLLATDSVSDHEELPPTTPAPATSTASNPSLVPVIPGDKPTKDIAPAMNETRNKGLPRALKNLQSYNKPGLKE